MTLTTPSRPSRPVPGATCCQRSRNRMKSRRGDRLDLAALPLPGVGVDAGQQPPGAELLVRPSGAGEAAADARSPRSPAGPARSRCQSAGSPVASARSATVDGPRQSRWPRSMSAAASSVGSRRLGRAPGRARMVGDHGGVREQRPRRPGGVPPRTTAPRPGRAPLTARRSRASSSEPGPPLLVGPQRDQRSSAGRAARRRRGGRAGPARRPARWRRVEPAQLAGARPAGRGAAAPRGCAAPPAARRRGR